MYWAVLMYWLCAMCFTTTCFLLRDCMLVPWPSPLTPQCVCYLKCKDYWALSLECCQKVVSQRIAVRHCLIFEACKWYVKCWFFVWCVLRLLGYTHAPQCLTGQMVMNTQCNSISITVQMIWKLVNLNRRTAV